MEFYRREITSRRNIMSNRHTIEQKKKKKKKKKEITVTTS